MTRKTVLLLLTALLILPLLAACSSNPAQGAGQGALKMAPMDTMPDYVKEASQTVREGYQFAVANPDVLKELPCYCGCGAMGHTSNYACYVQSDEGGQITYDGHALGCSICVDITQDAMRMMKEGRTLQEIRVAVDDTYSKFGPSNMEE